MSDEKKYGEGILGRRIIGLGSSKPSFYYSGVSQLIMDDDINWRIKFLTSGTLILYTPIFADIFGVGGGGGGGYTHRDSLEYLSSGGGGGGYTETIINKYLKSGKYSITIGDGGKGGYFNQGFGYNDIDAEDGGETVIKYIYTTKNDEGKLVENEEEYMSVNGGKGGTASKGGNGGSGGGGPNETGLSNGAGGGESPNLNSGTGQKKNTYAFLEDPKDSSNTTELYSGGGGGGGQSGGSGGGGSSNEVKRGQRNTGGGGGGGANKYRYVHGTAGGSGILIIRNNRYPLLDGFILNKDYIS